MSYTAAMALQAQGISVNKTVQARQQGIAAGIQANTVQSIASRRIMPNRPKQTGLK